MRRNFVKNQIRISNRHRNVLKFSASETDAHIFMKLEICKWLKRKGKEFYTEAIFNNNIGRADIVNADDLIRHFPANKVFILSFLWMTPPAFSLLGQKLFENIGRG